VDGQGPQLVLELLDVEHHQPAVQFDVRGSSEQPSAERSLDVALEPHGQAGDDLTRHVAKNHVQVLQEWRWPAMRGHVGGDPGLCIRPVDGAVEHGPFVVVERAGSARRVARATQHDFEQAEQCCHALGEGIRLGTVAIPPDILGRQWQVEGIDAVGRRCCQPHHQPTGRLGNTAVLVFGVDDDAVGAVDELPQDMQLAEEALAGAGGRHDDQVGIVQ